MWYAQLVVRILPKLIAETFGDKVSLTESFGALCHNMSIHQWLMGVVSHEVAWADVALPFLQRECKFEEGELTVITLYAYGTLSHLLEDNVGEPGAGGRVEVGRDQPRVHGFEARLQQRVHRAVAERLERREARLEHLLRAVLEADRPQEGDDTGLAR